MTIETITDLEQFRALRPDWDALADSPFASHLWLETWAEQFLGANRLHVLLARRDGKLVGAAPLFVTQQFGLTVLQFIGMKNVNGELVSFMFGEAEVGRELFAALLAARWDAISAYGIRSSAPLFVTQNQCKVISTSVGTAPVIRLPGDWEAFLKSCSKNFRRNYKRHTSDGEAAGIRITSDSPANVVERLISVETRAWQSKRGKQIIASQPAFFAKVLPAMLANGQADIVWAVKGDEPVAFLLTLFCRDRAYLYLTAYDSSFENLSLGSLVHYAAIQKYADRGVKVIDFLTGYEPYKERWTQEFEVAWKHVLVRRTFRGRLVALTQL